MCPRQNDLAVVEIEPGGGVLKTYGSVFPRVKFVGCVRVKDGVSSDHGDSAYIIALGGQANCATAKTLEVSLSEKRR